MAGLIIILAFAVVLFLAVYNNLSGTSSAAMDGVMLVAAVGLVAVIGAVLALLVHDEFQKQRLESGRPKYRLNFRRSWRNMWRRWKALILALVTGLGLLLAFKSCTLPETPAPAPSDTPPAAQPAPPPPVVPDPQDGRVISPEPQVDPTPPEPQVDLILLRSSLETALRSWADDWAQRRIEAYLAHYSQRFIPADGLSRTAWERQRRERLAKARNITLEADQVVIQSLDAERAEIRFRQTYKAANYSDVSYKHMTWVQEAGIWKILRERTQP